MKTTWEELLKELEDQPFSKEFLAEKLGKYLPEQSEEEIRTVLGQLEAGIRSGEEKFEELYQTPEAELDGKAETEFEKLLAPYPEDRQKQLLLMMMQALCLESDMKIDEKTALYISSLPISELRRTVEQLLKDKGMELAGNEALALMEAQELPERKQLSDSRYTEQERSLIMAAVIYVSIQKAGVKNLRADQLGEQVGIQKSFAERLGEALRYETMPMLIRVLIIGAIAVAVYELAQIAIVEELLTFAYSYMTENHHLWKIAIPAVVAAAGMGLKWLDEKLSNRFPFLFRCKSAAQDARTDFERNFDEIRERANRNEQIYIVPDMTGEVEEDPRLAALETDPEIVI